MRINQKAEKKMCLAQPKTQLFEKSCILGSGKKEVQNVQNLWTAGGPQIKTRMHVFLITVGPMVYYENAHK